VRFSVLSHAGLLVEHAGVRLVSDPWLIGSCYWRSWWNLPEPPAALIDGLEVDYIYLTHLHWDHFHGPSLRRLLRPGVRVLVPKVPTRRMLEDLEYLGFKDVVEIPHGTRFELAPDFSLWSYQFGAAVDSAMVLEADGVTLLNANDTKHFGLPLKQITARFPRFDFVLRSHSSATPVPYCIEGQGNAFASLRSQRDYIEEFCRFALHVRARHAVPFASNHCFLHRETLRFNATAVSPDDVAQRYAQLAEHAGFTSDCVVMPPGSRWSQTEGFELAAFDYSDRANYVESLRARHAATLERQYADEAAARVDLAAVDAYFVAFMRAVPRWLGRALADRTSFVARDGTGEHVWLLDFAAGSARRVAAPDPAGIVIELPALVLNDCARQRMFSVWSPSKRLSIRLGSPRQVGALNGVLNLLDFHELDMLPLHRNFTLRALGVRARRWRDALEAVALLLKHRVLGRRFNVASLYELPGASSGR
jgi:UDP-MurNAc hydroxylase